jgi:hypothetical protein
MRDKPKVGEILVQAGIIDELQLASALGEQARWGRRLGMTLIKLGMVQEGQLVRALAKQFDLPVASLAGKKIAPEVIALVPAKVACEHSVIPLFVKKEGRKGQLFLGMEEPSDLGVLDDLAFRTGMMIRPVMVGPSEIGEAIDRYYTGKPAAAAPAPAEPIRSGDTSARRTCAASGKRRPPTIAPLPELPLVVAVPEPDPVEEITAPALRSSPRRPSSRRHRSRPHRSRPSPPRPLPPCRPRQRRSCSHRSRRRRSLRRWRTPRPMHSPSSGPGSSKRPSARDSSRRRSPIS